MSHKNTHANDSRHDKRFHGAVLSQGWQSKSAKPVAAPAPAASHLDDPMNADAALSPFWAWRITTSH
jgi:hypothetical protein